jgi:hypothetical protein
LVENLKKKKNYFPRDKEFHQYIDFEIELYYLSFCLPAHPADLGFVSLLV